MLKIFLRRILPVILVILIVATGGFLVWANTPLAPTQEALAALESDASVQVDNQNGWYVFSPRNSNPTTGFIFYPGGRVDARAYAPQVRAIAEKGYLAVIVPMPLNLAVFGLEKGSEVIRAFPDVQQWAIGGHSLGGAMAARFVQAHPEMVEGIIFWASYPDIDLSTFNINVTSIYGTNDAVAQRSTITESEKRLPPDSVFIAIEGGNHSQFGWYGLQPGDNEATISHDEQQAETVKAAVTLLAGLE